MGIPMWIWGLIVKKFSKLQKVTEVEKVLSE